MQSFDKLTIVIMASNEQESLRETIRALSDCCNPSDIQEIIVFLKTSDCFAAGEALRMQREDTTPFPIRSYVQKETTIQRAFSEIPSLVNSSHFLVMFADYATDPASVPVLIEKAKQFPKAIICAAKWNKDSVVHGYGFIRKVGSIMINRLIAMIWHIEADDLFSVFQIVPKSICDLLEVNNPKTFLYEYTLKPLACGVQYIEVPTVYLKRTENRSNYHCIEMLKTGCLFFCTAIRIKLR